MSGFKFKSGFSLVEVAIILVVVSVIGGLTLGLAPKSENQDAEALTRKNLKTIENAIFAFYNQNGFLPCPATLNGTGTNIGVATNCASTLSDGTVLEIDSDPNRLRVGSIPIKSLDLSPRDMIDGWENRILYAVPTELARNVTRFNAYTNTSNAIRVVNVENEDLNQGEIAFVLYSTGQNRMGGYSALGSGSTLPILACGSGDEAENCDGDDIFKKSFFDPNSATYYDDFVQFTTLTKVRERGNYAKAGGGSADIEYALLKDYGSNENSPGSPGRGYMLFFRDIDTNTISGLSTAPNGSGYGTNVFIPPGKYLMRINTHICGSNGFNNNLWNATDSEIISTGLPHYTYSNSNPDVCGRSFTMGVFDNSSGTTKTVQSYAHASNNGLSDGNGRASSLPNVTFRSFEILKLE